MRIRIITDNCCDLPSELIEKYDIGIVPLRVRFGDEELPLDDFDHDAFYKRMAQSPVLPNTNQPLPVDFLEEYNKALDKYDAVLSIHLSSGISGTVQAAHLAAQMVERPGIYVFDSLKASVGEGLLVLEAARMAESGAEMDSILLRLEEMQRRMQCVFVVGNLDALLKGGRLTKTKALLANTLDIKPVLHFDAAGKIVPYSKARGHKGARKKLIDIIRQESSDIARQTVGICHSACPEDAEFIKQEIIKEFGVQEIVIGAIGPVIGSHVGPGTFSVFFES